MITEEQDRLVDRLTPVSSDKTIVTMTSGREWIIYGNTADVELKIKQETEDFQLFVTFTQESTYLVRLAVSKIESIEPDTPAKANQRNFRAGREYTLQR